MKKNNLSQMFLICVTSMILMTTCRACAGSNVELTEDKIEKIERVMNRIGENGQFSGTILVAVNGEVIYQKAHGFANLDGSVNGFGSHIQRIENNLIFIAILRNMKEPNQQIVKKWPSFMASRILAILYDEAYDMPKKSAAYEVFRFMLSSGLQAGIEKYHEIDENLRDQYYFDDEEWNILGLRFYEARKLREAMGYLRLIPHNKDVLEMINKLEKEMK